MIKVAIIGTGNISPQHIQGYLQFSDRCKIVALADIYPEKARDKKERFNLEDADVYDDYKKVLERNDIDLIDICTPPYTHAEIAVNALNTGKHVLVEKPMASSLEECDKMIKASEKNNKLLSVVAQNRFTTQFMKLKHVVDSGLAGDIVHAQVDSLWWRGYSYYDLWWRGTWEREGGGCTLNHAIHHIDMLLWLMGMPEEVQAVMNNVAHENAEVEDISIAILKYKNGAVGQITSSVIHHGEEQQIVLQGKKARISAPWKVYASIPSSNGFPAGRDEKLEKELQDFYNKLPDLKYKGHTAQINDVLNAIEMKQDVLVSGKDGRNALELITAIYESASTEQPVKLPLSERDPFYTVLGIRANVPYFYKKKTFIENFDDENITFGRII
ncbi:oxidoreductase domain protein [Thermoanaerobacter mathranii subsp. mathranii str. A3]|uniref:Oxidoreductase domain protein n=1 Tax=Thermoanaerobacter mathranii subsp. mathranii (strain DSM 11426 / CCUG 53645 / CIP 108742 / A3) TaxID=583358 RepID=A0ABN3Z0J6_THEM3|nr:Gfo/Idh/MocA family oxidoreductase [Thermoanaerobacter mathranii]ADH60019.1 oxidoreductase domain protein [Thermoanaerobacter mathranii subsp. mathranii str. A3]